MIGDNGRKRWKIFVLHNEIVNVSLRADNFVHLKTFQWPRRKMAQWDTMLVAKSDNLSLVPGTHIGEAEPFLNIVL